MHNVLKSVFVASLVSITMSGASYALLAPHDDIIQGFAQTLAPWILPEEATAVVLPVVPQAVIVLISLVTGALGFAVALLTAGAYFSTCDSETHIPISRVKMNHHT